MNTSTLPVLPDDELVYFKKAAAVFRALNHPLRQKILSLLHQHEKLRVTELFIKLRMEQPVVSQHLALMRQAGLVKAEKKGKFVFYSVDYNRVEKIKAVSERLVRQEG
jgi:DNA-binding transcriptional ArsR family regulator